MIEPFEETDDMCDYERQRMQNIKDIYLSYGDLMVGVKVSTEDLLKSVSSSQTKEASVNGRKRRRNWQRVKKCTTLDDNGNPPACIKRSARLRNVKRKPSDYIDNISDNSDSDDDKGSRKKKPRQGSLRLKFPWYKNKENVERDRIYYGCLDDNDFVVSDEDEANYNGHVSHSKRKRSEVSTARLPVSQVTPKMLDNIMYYSAGKEYSSDGTTCHQCRQKTTDQKSYCRYKGCRGVRGMFCGFCLGKRYGEDVAEVLLNPKWACPVCRGYCNCSICRRKNGKEPTGQLAQRAEAGGFKSVRHLLNKIEGEDTEKFSDGEYEHDGNNLENIVVEQENCISEVNNSELDDVKIENDVINYQPKKESQNCKDANDEVKNLCFADTKAENNIAEDLSGSNKPVLNVSNCSNSDEQHISDIIIDVNKDTSEMIIDKLYQKLFTNSQSTHIY